MRRTLGSIKGRSGKNGWDTHRSSYQVGADDDAPSQVLVGRPLGRSPRSVRMARIPLRSAANKIEQGVDSMPAAAQALGREQAELVQMAVDCLDQALQIQYSAELVAAPKPTGRKPKVQLAEEFEEAA